MKALGLICAQFAHALGFGAILFGCTQNNDNAPTREITWAITDDCRSCLAFNCAVVDGGTAPIYACNAQEECYAAFAEFTNCYRLSRSLSACKSEIDRVRRSGSAGSDLLQNCFLLDCFDGHCEGSGSAAQGDRLP
jgi:hypothetical protein